MSALREHEKEHASMSTLIPPSAGYVVVGAGIHGLSTAWHLAMELEARGTTQRTIRIEAKCIERCRKTGQQTAQQAESERKPNYGCIGLPID